VFIGSKRMGLRCVTAMQASGAASVAAIVTFDDRADGRTIFKELHCFGEAHRIPVAVVHGDASLLTAVREVEPEVAIVCGWYSMISTQTRAVARRGFIGVHNSLLPRYRGAAPLVWALMHGEGEVGLSMYTLTDGMDDGDVWAQISTAVAPDEYIGTVLERLEDACEGMIRDAYPRILDGHVTAVSQDGAKATYGTIRTPAHGCIDWRDTAVAIGRAIRAQSRPYPGAFTTYEGRRLVVWRAHLFSSPYYGRPGEVARGPHGEMMVICGDDRALVLDEIQTDELQSNSSSMLRPRALLGN
jgi:methionyl-tRNA formyltransferase